MGHYTWIFSGIGVAALSGIVAIVLHKNRARQSSLTTSAAQLRNINAGGNVSITISDSGNVSQGVAPTDSELPPNGESTRIPIYFCLYDGRKGSYYPPDRSGLGSVLDSRLTARQLTTPSMLKIAFGIDVDPGATVDLLHVEGGRFLKEGRTLSQAGVQSKHTLGIVIDRGNMTASMLKTLFSLQS